MDIYFFVKIVICVWKDKSNNDKEAGMAHF